MSSYTNVRNETSSACVGGPAISMLNTTAKFVMEALSSLSEIFMVRVNDCEAPASRETDDVLIAIVQFVAEAYDMETEMSIAFEEELFVMVNEIVMSSPVS